MAMFHDLPKRIIVSAISLLILGLLIYFVDHPTVFYGVLSALGLLAAVGVYEYAQLSRVGGKYLLATLAFLVVFSQHFDLGWAVLCGAALLLFCLHFHDLEGGFDRVARSFFGLIYVAVPLGLTLEILPYGRWWIVYVVVVTKGTDVCAYMAGRAFGRHKLPTLLSPAKTWEGAFAGLVGASLASFLFGFFGLMPLKISLILGLLIGVISQLGDLAESLLKRQAKVKDSSRIPGFGGILDMVDSILFTLPLVFFYLKL